MKYAYLQSAFGLKRRTLVNPECIDLALWEILQAIRPLQGLTGNGDYWCEKKNKFQIAKLRMQQRTSDLHTFYTDFFFRKLYNKLSALSESYVDDILQAGTPIRRSE